MANVLEGVRVLEVATWVFVPSAGAALAEWGADVMKVEHPRTGDPVRGLITAGLLAGGDTGGRPPVNYMFEQSNRGKRSIAVDISHTDGHALLSRLIEECDVFLTNFLPEARQRLGIDVADVRAINPRIIYVRGSGHGARGPEANKGGMDFSSFWARGGVANAITPAGADYPVGQPPAFGDLTSGMMVAAGVAAALYRRERTGEASTVDVSLLGTAMWGLSPSVVASKYFGESDSAKYDRYDSPNPVTHVYRTKDRRFVNLNILEGDRYWSDFCAHIDRVDLVDDPRFDTSAARASNRNECIKVLEAVFAQRTLAEWRSRLATMEGVWAPVQNAREVHEDQQVIANSYLGKVDVTGAQGLDLVHAPVQFDETELPLHAAPEHGQHTEEILLELGFDWDQILEFKESGAIL